MALMIVVGPPTGGKSTWVLQRATTSDVVIDFDRLATALTGVGASGHDHHGAVHGVTRAARRAAIDLAVTHADRTDVYIIHSSPSAAMMERYRALGGQVIVIDPGREVTLRRCAAERPKRMLAAVEAWYDRAETWQQQQQAVTSRRW